MSTPCPASPSALLHRCQ